MDMLAYMFGRDTCEFVEKNFDEIISNEMFSSMNGSTVNGQVIDRENEEPILNDGQEQVNMQIEEQHQGDRQSRDMSYRSFDDWIFAEFEQSNNTSTGNEFFQPPQLAHNISSLSLPATPTTATTPTEKKRKSFRNCCKAIKSWLKNKPKKLLPTAQAVFPEYSAEIEDALKMKGTKPGRPLIQNGKLSPEKRKQFRSIYDLNKECMKFIASFVRKYNNGYAATMKLEDFMYPVDIDGPKKLSKSCRHTQ